MLEAFIASAGSVPLGDVCFESGGLRVPGYEIKRHSEGLMPRRYENLVGSHGPVSGMFSDIRMGNVL